MRTGGASALTVGDYNNADGVFFETSLLFYGQNSYNGTTGEGTFSDAQKQAVVYWTRRPAGGAGCSCVRITTATGAPRPIVSNSHRV